MFSPCTAVFRFILLFCLLPPDCFANLPDDMTYQIDHTFHEHDPSNHEPKQCADNGIQRKDTDPSRYASTDRQNEKHIRKSKRNPEYHAETEPVDLSVHYVNVLPQESNQQDCHNGKDTVFQ